MQRELHIRPTLMGPASRQAALILGCSASCLEVCTWDAKLSCRGFEAVGDNGGACR